MAEVGQMAMAGMQSPRRGPHRLAVDVRHVQRLTVLAVVGRGYQQQSDGGDEPGVLAPRRPHRCPYPIRPRERQGSGLEPHHHSTRAPVRMSRRTAVAQQKGAVSSRAQSHRGERTGSPRVAAGAMVAEPAATRNARRTQQQNRNHDDRYRGDGAADRMVRVAGRGGSGGRPGLALPDRVSFLAPPATAARRAGRTGVHRRVRPAARLRPAGARRSPLRPASRVRDGLCRARWWGGGAQRRPPVPGRRGNPAWGAGARSARTRKQAGMEAAG